MKLLRAAERSFVALACAMTSQVLLFRGGEFLPLIENMNFTEGANWHIRVSWGAVVLLDQPKATTARLDVTRWILPATPAGG